MLNTSNGGYALPFEVVSMLLLAAMVGCIVIAMKAPAHSSPKGRELEPFKKSVPQTLEFADKESQKVFSLGESLGDGEND
jgi:NADH-quinone oxidoreductase subunit J